MFSKNEKELHAPRTLAAPFQHQATEFCEVIDATTSVSKDSQSIRYKDFRSHKFPPLQPLKDLRQQDYVGPTTESNWVIPNVLLVGAYPATSEDDETFEILASILKLGIKKFVCLQQEYKPSVPEELWRSGLALRPYFNDVDYMVRNKTHFPSLLDSEIVSIEELSFDHCPIVDCGITDDGKVLELSRKLVHEISNGQVIYLHCWGGHGRTGTVVSIMLHLMYGLNAVEAMNRCQIVHDLRKCPVDVGSPQTQAQRDQVTRVINRLIQEYSPEQKKDDKDKTVAASQRKLSKPSRSFTAIYEQTAAVNGQRQPISRFPYFHYSANNLVQLKSQAVTGSQPVSHLSNKAEPHISLAKSSTTSSSQSMKTKKNAVTRKSVLVMKEKVQEKNFPGIAPPSTENPREDSSSRSESEVLRSAVEAINRQIGEVTVTDSTNNTNPNHSSNSKDLKEQTTLAAVTTTENSSTTNNTEVTTASVNDSNPTSSSSNKKGTSSSQSASFVRSIVGLGGSKKMVPMPPSISSNSSARFGVANFMNRTTNNHSTNPTTSNSHSSTHHPSSHSTTTATKSKIPRSPQGKEFLSII